MKLLPLALTSIFLLGLASCEPEVPGPQGEPGVPGSFVLVGQTSPSNSFGKIGDVYIDAQTGELFVKEAASGSAEGMWFLKGSIKGATGSSGTNGINGATWYAEVGVPDPVKGEMGDYYLNLSTSDVYLKEGANNWRLVSKLTPPPAEGTFYLQQNFLGYKGAYEATVGTQSPTSSMNNPNTSIFISDMSTSTNPASRTNGLFYFDVSQLQSRFLAPGESCANDLVVAEASLTLHSSNFQSPQSLRDGAILSLHSLHPAQPLFDMNTASWSFASTNNRWVNFLNQSPTQLDGLVTQRRFTSIAYPPLGGFFTFQLDRDIVQNWICNSAQNKGMMLSTTLNRTNSATSFSDFIYITSSSMNTSDVNRPMFRIRILRRGLNNLSPQSFTPKTAIQIQSEIKEVQYKQNY